MLLTQLILSLLRGFDQSNTDCPARRTHGVDHSTNAGLVNYDDLDGRAALCTNPFERLLSHVDVDSGLDSIHQQYFVQY